MNQIEIYERNGNVIRARLLFPRPVEVAITLAPGDDLAALLEARYNELAPTYAALPENPEDDPPAMKKAALSTFDGAAWTGSSPSMPDGLTP